MRVCFRGSSNDVNVGNTAMCLAQAYSSVCSPDADCERDLSWRFQIHGCATIKALCCIIVGFSRSVSAESYFNDAIAIYKLHYGPSNEVTIGAQDELAHLQIRTDRTDVRRGHTVNRAILLHNRASFAGRSRHAALDARSEEGSVRRPLASSR